MDSQRAFFDAVTSRSFFQRLLHCGRDTPFISFHVLRVLVWHRGFVYVRKKQVEVLSFMFYLPFVLHHRLVAFSWFDPAFARRPLAPAARPTVPEQAGGAALPRVEGLCRPDPHA